MKMTVNLPRLSLPFSERRLLLIALDLLTLNAALSLYLTLRPDIYLSWTLIRQNPAWFFLVNLLWFPLAHFIDLFDLKTAREISSWAPRVAIAGGAVAAVYTLTPFLPPALPPSRWPLFAFLLATPLALLLGRGIYTFVFTQPLFQSRTLIIGAGWAGRTIAQALTESGEGVYKIIGFIDDDPHKLGQEISIPNDLALVSRSTPGGGKLVACSDPEGSQSETSDLMNIKGTSAQIRGKKKQRCPTNRRYKILDNCHALKDLIRQHNISTLIHAITHQGNGELLGILMDCLELGIEIIPMPDLYERLTSKVPVEHIGDNWYVAMPLQHPGTKTLWPLVNRVFDIMAASIGLLLLGLATPFISLAIYLDSPGPIFYTQERVGKGGKVFSIYKFRSMITDAEQGKVAWAVENDDRVTRVGRLLRKTHVDEFPQFLNILKGEMSAVGPRPERPEFVEELAHEIPFYRARHAVKPGMAGWGLVKQGYGSSKEDALTKLQYDLYYIKHQSLWLDIIILLKTILDTLTLSGR